MSAAHTHSTPMPIDFGPRSCTISACLVDGKLVWLCWRFDEEEVGFYHALDEGFAGRKPIGKGLRQRLLN